MEECCLWKSVADHTTVDKWWPYRVVIGYELIDQGNRFSSKDPKDQDLSMDKFTYYSMGYTGCGLDDFDKKGEWKEKLRFQAGAFFKSVKFQKDLIQPIRDCINLVHEDYMKMLHLMDWSESPILEWVITSPGQVPLPF